jgi:muramoyltetrapeptide carboxypeptidase
MRLPIVRPAALRRGDTIGIIAPAGPIQQRDALERGIASLESLGFKVRCDERVLESWKYLAGHDASRAEELMRHFEDPEIHAIVALRGGYGCARLLPLIDEGRLGPYCKIFMGFSDLTTLHLFFLRRFGWVTIHGPMATSPTLANLEAPAEDHLAALLSNPDYKPKLSFPDLRVLREGVAEGPLVGGCLSLVVASMGTPYEIETDGKVLFLEDLGEPAYRIDRMLTQLGLAGTLAQVKGIVLGSFKDCAPSEGDYTAEETLKEILVKLDIPILAEFPAGHGTSNWPIPLGVPVRLDTGRKEVEFLEAAVR